MYLTGALGVQAHPIDTQAYSQQDYQYTNELGRYLGEVRLVIEFGDQVYVEAKHLSGINVAEHDNGLNAIMIGTKINLWQR